MKVCKINSLLVKTHTIPVENWVFGFSEKPDSSVFSSHVLLLSTLVFICCNTLMFCLFLSPVFTWSGKVENRKLYGQEHFMVLQRMIDRTLVEDSDRPTWSVPNERIFNCEWPWNNGDKLWPNPGYGDKLRKKYGVSSFSVLKLHCCFFSPQKKSCPHWGPTCWRKCSGTKPFCCHTCPTFKAWNFLHGICPPLSLSLPIYIYRSWYRPVLWQPPK